MNPAGNEARFAAPARGLYDDAVRDGSSPAAQEPAVDRRTIPALLAGLVALVALMSPPEPAADDELSGQTCEAEDRLFFAMSIEDEAGAVLAEPKLLGMCGVPVEMNLSDPGQEEPRMSLWLDPQGTGDGGYEIAFEVSVPGKVEKGKGSFKVRPGEGRSAKVSYPGGSLRVQLAAFAVPSVELELYLKQGAAALLRPGST